MFDKLRDHCGVVGVFGHPEAATIAYLALHALQHREPQLPGMRRPGVEQSGHE